jgi:hypothetical protein
MVAISRLSALQEALIVRAQRGVPEFSACGEATFAGVTGTASFARVTLPVQISLTTYEPYQYRNRTEPFPYSCSQMAGRDGVHVSFNDGLDRRVTTPYKATEYVVRELDRQLQRIPAATASIDAEATPATH